MQTELEILRKENARLTAKVSALEERLRLHILARFGRKSETYVDPNQPSLFNEVEADVEAAKEDEETVEVGPYKKKRGHRRPLPEFLPRERIEHDLSEEEKTCSIHGKAMVKIGEDVSEQLEIIPEQITVLQHVRPKYKCPCCEGGIAQMRMPAQPIPGSMASPSLLSFVCVSKYVDHLPLYRLEKRFERVSVELPRLTMARWMIKLGDLFTPLYNLLQDELMDGGMIQMDETTVQVLKEKDRSPSSKSYMWVRARDGSTGPPIVLFDYSPTRSAKVIEDLLSGYKGILQTDGYSAYDAFAAAREITHAGCLAHCRRKFWEAFKASKRSKGSLSVQALDRIKAIYKVEAETKTMTPDERLQHRREKMRPLFYELKRWLDEKINETPASLKTGEAMRYLSEQWPKLLHVFDDGRIPLDNNFVEGRIRPFTLGRKNWMFSDTTAGAKSSAMIYSIIETARANGVEPFAYLQHVITKLPAASSAEEIESLLPHNYKKQNLH